MIGRFNTKEMQILVIPLAYNMYYISKKRFACKSVISLGSSYIFENFWRSPFYHKGNKKRRRLFGIRKFS